MVVQQQRVVLFGRVREVPHLTFQERIVLQVEALLIVPGDVHQLTGTAPHAGLLLSQAGLVGDALVVPGATCPHPFGGLDRAEQVLARHEVGVEVVVDHRGVLVGPGHSVDHELAAHAFAEEAEVYPEASCLDEDLETGIGDHVQVARGPHVLAHGPDHVGVYVVLGGTGRVVRRSLFAVDRAPRVQRAVVADLLGTVAREAEHPGSESDEVPRQLGLCVGEVGHHVDV